MSAAPRKAKVRPVKAKKEPMGAVSTVIVVDPEGAPLLAVGRDLTDPKIADLIRLDVIDVSILLGPRNAILLGRALLDYAGTIFASDDTAAHAAAVVH